MIETRAIARRAAPTTGWPIGRRLTANAEDVPGVGQCPVGAAPERPDSDFAASDLAAEQAVRSVLAERRRGDSIMAEEGGESEGGEVRWVVDPLDGTINYLFGIPAYAVSIACEDSHGALAGVVLDPSRDERF